MKRGIFLMILVGLFGCGPKTEFFLMSEFKVNQRILQNGDGVKILYCSGSPEETFGSDFYIHLIAEVEESSDTINIFAFEQSFHINLEADKVFYFSDTRNYLENRLGFDKLGDEVEISFENLNKIVKGPIDPSWDYKSFPSIIGTITDKK